MSDGDNWRAQLLVRNEHNEYFGRQALNLWQTLTDTATSGMVKNTDQLAEFERMEPVIDAEGRNVEADYQRALGDTLCDNLHQAMSRADQAERERDAAVQRLNKASGYAVDNAAEATRQRQRAEDAERERDEAGARAEKAEGRRDSAERRAADTSEQLNRDVQNAEQDRDNWKAKTENTDVGRQYWHNRAKAAEQDRDRWKQQAEKTDTLQIQHQHAACQPALDQVRAERDKTEKDLELIRNLPGMTVAEDESTVSAVRSSLDQAHQTQNERDETARMLQRVEYRISWDRMVQQLQQVKAERDETWQERDEIRGNLDEALEKIGHLNGYIDTVLERASIAEDQRDEAQADLRERAESADSWYQAHLAADMRADELESQLDEVRVNCQQAIDERYKVLQKCDQLRHTLQQTQHYDNLQPNPTASAEGIHTEGEATGHTFADDLARIRDRIKTAVDQLTNDLITKTGPDR